MLPQDATRVVYTAVYGEKGTDNLEHGGRTYKVGRQ